MLIQGQVGQPNTISMSPGATPAIRQGQLGDVITSNLHGNYYEAAYRQNVYTLSVTTAAAITAYIGAAGGTPMLAVYNPVGSGKIIIPLQASVNNVVASSLAGTVSFALWYGPTAAITQTTLTYPVNNYTLNRLGSVSQCFTNVALTSSTALINAYGLGFYYWATGAGAFATSLFTDIQGSFILQPGTMMALGGSAALTSATFIGSLTWEEIAI
jgi:hypothetical protein